MEICTERHFLTVTARPRPGTAAEIATFDLATVKRLMALMPIRRAGSNGKRHGKRDNSGSGYAFRLAYRIGQQQHGTKDDWLVSGRADPIVGEWMTRVDDRQLQRAWDNAQLALPNNEEGLATLFAIIHGDEARYCNKLGTWFVWDGQIWRPEDTLLALHSARVICRMAAVEHPRNGDLGKVKTMAAVERIARADRIFAVTTEIWDCDPMLLGTPGGTVNLRSGDLCPADPTNYISKSTAVAPADTADCPMWRKFLNEATQGDAELVRFLQMFIGYCLTGSIKEHATIFLHGAGGAGKTTFVETLGRMLGDYSVATPMETFLAGRFDRHPTEIARFRGVRLVMANETPQGQTWNETRIKEMTGGDTVSARFMRQDFFDFVPEFKIAFRGNHKPTLTSVGNAMRRKINLVPFNATPRRIDLDLAEKFRSEWPGILRWAIDGCLTWQAHGLIRPDVVKQATERYFAEQDAVARWVEERCDLQPNAVHGVDDLFQNFWMSTGAKADRPTQLNFIERMERLLGYSERRAKMAPWRDRYVFDGITLRRDNRARGETSQETVWE